MSTSQHRTPVADDRGAAEVVADPVPPQRAPDAEEAPEKRGFTLPSPVGILLIVMVGVWLLALAIPSGTYQFDDNGAPIAGSYTTIDSPLDFGERVRDLLLAPVNGLYGILDPSTGQVGPFNSGGMFGSVQVFLFILAIGGFMTVVFKTGSLDLGISKLAHRFASRGSVLIIVLSMLFGFLGSVITWSDESLGFYALLVPLLLALGYDRMTAVAVITVAPFVGSIGATITPFRIGVGSDAAGISIGDGIVLRLLLFVLTMAAMIVFTLRYANRVKNDPSLSLVPHDPEDTELVQGGARDDLPDLTGRDKAVIGLLAFTFALLIFSIVPWGSILNNTAVDPVTHKTVSASFAWELGWWMPELTAMFVVMAMVIAVVARMSEAETASTFLKGMADFSGPAALVALARGVAVILNNTATIDTILNSMEGVVYGRSSVVFILLLAVVSLPLGFLVGSGSAGMALVMPVLAPLGDFAGVDRSLVVTTYNSMGAWLNLLLPTNAILVAGLALGRVGFGKYVKFMMPLLGILLGLTLLILIVGTFL
ncbi:MAG: YfcC family protein [Micropruina sp.]|nr:YfcC family protein [Micropruina sp.]